MKQSTVHKRMLVVFVFMGALFFLLMLMLSFFELHGKSKIMNNSYNRRLMVYEQAVNRGAIYDRKGVLLAKSTFDGPNQEREYPYNALYAHVIGYNSKIYGKSMLEMRFNDALLGRDGFSAFRQMLRTVKEEPLKGNDLYLTIDHTLQSKARALMGKNHGAVVAIDPKTGEVLAMVSTPDFDPNEKALLENWVGLLENEDSPLLPRATMGLYPPGSTYKMVTAFSAMNQGLDGFVLNDQGSTIIDGKVFSNASQKKLGEIGLKEGIAQSSNVYFVELSKTLDPKKLIQSSEAFGFGQQLAFSLPISKSRMGSKDMGTTEFAATTIGQGRLMVTPMHMALIAAWIGNDGDMMRPYLVKGYEKEKNMGRLGNEANVRALKEMMVSVVEEGTGQKAAVKGYKVAGKTGTAQNERSAQGENNDHAWFIGFAPADNPTIALAVVLEYQGQGGGQAAAPIAQKLFAHWLNSNN